jgi:hypothetical protein
VDTVSRSSGSPSSRRSDGVIDTPAAAAAVLRAALRATAPSPVTGTLDSRWTVDATPRPGLGTPGLSSDPCMDSDTSDDDDSGDSGGGVGEAGQGQGDTGAGATVVETIALTTLDADDDSEVGGWVGGERLTVQQRFVCCLTLLWALGHAT